MNQRDVAALARMYDDRVRFGGNDYAKETLLGMREGAFKALPTYRIIVADPIKVTSTGAEVVVARFAKRSGPADNMQAGRGRLTLRLRRSAAPVITEEADETAPAPRASTNSPTQDCTSVAERVFRAMPEVKRVLDECMRLAANSDGGTTFDAVGPIYESNGEQSSFGVTIGGRFQERVSYVVKSGRLSVDVLGKGVTVPSDGLRDVERACR